MSNNVKGLNTFISNVGIESFAIVFYCIFHYKAGLKNATNIECEIIFQYDEKPNRFIREFENNIKKAELKKRP